MKNDQTPRVSVRIPPALFDAARVATGLPTATPSEVIRVALARLAGVDPSEYALRQGCRPPRGKAA